MISSSRGRLLPLSPRGELSDLILAVVGLLVPGSVGPKIRDSPCRTGYIGPVYQGSYYYLELTSCQV